MYALHPPTGQLFIRKCCAVRNATHKRTTKSDFVESGFISACIPQILQLIAILVKVGVFIFYKVDFSENDNAPSYKLFSLQSTILLASAPTSALDLETFTIKRKERSFTSVTYRTIRFKLNYFHSYDYGKY